MAGDLNTAVSVQIKEKLDRFRRLVRKQNERGLLDLTRRGEDAVCRLLNLAPGWDLNDLMSASDRAAPEAGPDLAETDMYFTPSRTIIPYFSL